MKAKLTKVTQDMEALENKKSSYLDWIEFTTTDSKLHVKKRKSSFWYFMLFSVLLMLSKGFRLLKGYVVFLRRKPQQRKG